MSDSDGDSAFPLAPYERFVVERMAEIMGVEEDEIVRRMVEHWVVDHSDQVNQADASFAAFNAWRI